jgi:hypothetical protein
MIDTPDISGVRISTRCQPALFEERRERRSINDRDRAWSADHDPEFVKGFQRPPNPVRTQAAFGLAVAVTTSRGVIVWMICQPSLDEPGAINLITIVNRLTEQQLPDRGSPVRHGNRCPLGPVDTRSHTYPQCALDTFRYPMLSRGVHVFRAPDSTQRRNHGQFTRRHVERCRRRPWRINGQCEPFTIRGQGFVYQFGFRLRWRLTPRVSNAQCEAVSHVPLTHSSRTVFRQ